MTVIGRLQEEPRKFGALLQDLRTGEISPIFSLVGKVEEMHISCYLGDERDQRAVSLGARAPGILSSLLPPSVRRRDAEQVTQCLCTSVSCTTKGDALSCLFHKMVIWGEGWCGLSTFLTKLH